MDGGMGVVIEAGWVGGSNQARPVASNRIEANGTDSGRPTAFTYLGVAQDDVLGRDAPTDAQSKHQPPTHLVQLLGPPRGILAAGIDVIMLGRHRDGRAGGWRAS